METKELFHPASASDDYYICCFSVVDAELFFRRGEIRQNQNVFIKTEVEEVVCKVIQRYCDFDLQFVCTASMYFVYIKAFDCCNVLDQVRYLLRVVYQIQKYLLFKLRLVACGIVTRGKKLQGNNFQMSLSPNRIVLDLDIASCSHQPYLVFDDLSIATAVDELTKDGHLYKTSHGLFLVNYFRFDDDLSMSQPLVDYITKNHKNNTIQTAQPFIFVEMFNNACSILQVNDLSNSIC